MTPQLYARTDEKRVVCDMIGEDIRISFSYTLA